MPPFRASLTLLALLVLPAVVSAQQQPGDKSVTVNGDLTFPTGGVSGSIFGSLGYFWTRQIELQGNIGLVASVSGGQSTTITILGAGANYNFATEGKKVFPYVGFELQAFSGAGTSSVGYRPHGGINDFLSRNAALNIDAGVSMSTGAGSQATPDVRFGLKFVF